MQRKGILYWTITRRQVSRDLWLLRPSPVINNILSGLAIKTFFRTGNEPSQQHGTKWSWNAPPKYGRIYDHKEAMSARNWHLPRVLPTTEQQRHLPSASTGDWAPCCYSCWPSTSPEGVQGGTLCSRDSGGTGLQIRTDFMISILASPQI